MSNAVCIYSGGFGRVEILELKEALTLHVHPHLHLLFHLSGEPLTFIVGDERVVLDEGRSLAINSWEPHQMLAHQGNEKVTVLVLYLDPAWFGNIAQKNGYLPLFPNSSLQTTPIMREISESIASFLLFTDYAIESFERNLEALILDVMGKCRPQFLKFWEMSTHSRASDHRLRRAMQYMGSHLRERENFEEVAKVAGLSRPHFFALFKKQMKLTPSLYWNSLKLELAISEITNNPGSLIDISYDLGFSCQGNFSRFFKSHAGISPGEFRRNTLCASASLNTKAPIDN